MTLQFPTQFISRKRVTTIALTCAALIISMAVGLAWVRNNQRLKAKNSFSYVPSYNCEAISSHVTAHNWQTPEDFLEAIESLPGWATPNQIIDDDKYWSKYITVAYYLNIQDNSFCEKVFQLLDSVSPQLGNEFTRDTAVLLLECIMFNISADKCVPGIRCWDVYPSNIARSDRRGSWPISWSGCRPTLATRYSGFSGRRILHVEVLRYLYKNFSRRTIIVKK